VRPPGARPAAQAILTTHTDKNNDGPCDHGRHIWGVIRRKTLAASGLAGVDLTYSEVGATAGVLPPGYRHVRREAEFRCSRDGFLCAAEALFRWDVHRMAGLSVASSGPANQAGTVAVLGFAIWGLTIQAPCRVVYKVEEHDRRSFAYGTLPGHPEVGEQAFALAFDPRGSVVCSVVAFSRPATILARIGGPVTAWTQDRLVGRYVTSLGQIATRGGSS
jgi:uncharacterized protein (UPF0548 family)